MDLKWTDLNASLSSGILKTLRRLKFRNPTPVQAAVIPLFLGRKDVAVEAVTGSGKTLAFIIPVLEILKGLDTPLKKHEIGALIISPTRELARQIFEVLDTFVSNVAAFSIQLLIGGTNTTTDDLHKFNSEGGNIVVATPGRLEDLLIGKSASYTNADFILGLKKLEILVLDEADRLLSMGFYKSVSTVITALPKQRRTALFSATQAKDIESLIRAGLRNPVLVSVKEKEDQDQRSTPSSLQNYYTVCDPKLKFSVLIHFLRREIKTNPDSKIILFFSTCACVEYFSLILERLLKSCDFDIFSLHRHKAKREKVFDGFRSSENGLLVCTDVMARGVDIPHVNWVLQYDPPSNAEAFVHRCGRTARIGRQGAALLFLLPTEDAYVNFIALNQKVSLEEMTLYEDERELPKVANEIRGWQRQDRSVFDKANRAFVSHVQAYSKHECKWVLRLKDLPLGEVATSMSLLRLPKMPELKNRKITGFTPGADLNINEIKYKDKQKETSRQEKLAKFKESGQWPGSKKKLPARVNTVAWSEKVDKKARRGERQRIKEHRRKRKAEVVCQQQDDDEDEDDLASDFKLVKKLKKGQITQEEFDQSVARGLEDL